MSRRLLGYALLADGLLVMLFDGGYVRIWGVRPLPTQLIRATRRASEVNPFLSRLLGIAEIGTGLVLIAMTSAWRRRAELARIKMEVREARRKAA
ncbi:MAG: hypothetical protein M1548_06035 [Actinobacteria bacterium]|nr:hypothetical protein [Actinomycetota bacterium]